MAYSGYLIKVGSYKIPLSYLQANAYSVTRNIQDLDSYRDSNGLLHRNALSHVPNKIVVSTVPMLTNTQLETLMSNIRSNWTIASERKASVTAYIPETNSYVTQDMYMSDPSYTMYFADSDKIQYNSIELTWIGY